ncbi:MAG: DUF2933 domain-containing protein [Candidatus Thermoplasmatota archaeon]
MDNEPHDAHEPRHPRVNFRSPTFWAFAAFGLVGLYYLVTQHPAHFWGYLPYVLLLACPLLHLFGGHGGHGGHRGEGK